MEHPSFLLINPPIYDFAAYDLWAKPLGLLYLAAILKKNNAEVSFLDCMDRSHPLSGAQSSSVFGCGRFYATEVSKPEAVKYVPRKYKRFGMSKEAIKSTLLSVKRPDAILMTSGMTYWYPGVQEMAALIKETFPGIPVILGGTYATVCPEHARSIPGIDHIFPGYDLAAFFEFLHALGFPRYSAPCSFSQFPAPSYELYAQLEYAATRLSRGCPFRCSYCAIKQLAGQWERKSLQTMVDEIEIYRKRAIGNIAFYDDALLYESETLLGPLLERICFDNTTSRNIPTLHTPNGMHARLVSSSIARMLKKSNFVYPRISLETSDSRRQAMTGGKVTSDEFGSAIENLKNGGYSPGEYIAYIMLGMPGQDLEEVERTMQFAHQLGCRISIAEYSPIPGTADWENVKQLVPSTDPLWHNNSLYPLFSIEQWPRLNRIKNIAKQLNQLLRCST